MLERGSGTGACLNRKKRVRITGDIGTNQAAHFRAVRGFEALGDLEKTAAYVLEIRQSVELAYQSLNDTHKNPRKSPHWFKSGELATRDLLRRLETFDHDMGYDDRPMLKALRDKVQEVHDDLLLGLMEGKLK